MGARTTEKYPLGIWANDWAAGHLTSDVVQIIIQDRRSLRRNCEVSLQSKVEYPLEYPLEYPGQNSPLKWNVHE